jgi:predicted MFS family arabinose efflux permease
MAAPSTNTGSATVKTQAAPRAGAVMAILLLIFFLGTSDNQMISPLLPYIAAEFGIAVGDVGQLMGPAYALAAATAALLIGPLSDRYGRRRFLLYGSVLFGASLLIVSAMQNVYALASVRLLTGLAAGTFSTCAIAYVGDYFPYERRGMAMSVVQAGYFAALVFGVPVANLLAQWQSWRASFALFGVIAAVAFFLVAALLPDDRHLAAEHGHETGSRGRFENVRLLFASVDRVAAIAAAFLVSAGFVGFIFYLGSWLKKTLELSANQINLFFAVVGVAALVGGLVAGPVADRFGKRNLSILSTAVLAAMLFIIPRLGWGVILFSGFLIASLAFAFRQGPLQALATEMVPRSARGSFVAVRNTASQMGIAVSTVVSGLLYDSAGYMAVGLFSGAVTLAGGLCIFLMREPQHEGALSDQHP